MSPTASLILPETAQLWRTGACEWGCTVDYPETSLFARNVEADLRDAASEQRKNDADAIKDARIDAYLDRRDFKVDPWQYPCDHHFAILLAI